MEKSKELLNYVNKELQKNIIITNSLIKKASEGSLKKALIKQRNGYNRYRNKIEQVLKDNDIEGQDLNQFSEKALQFISGLKVLVTKDESKLATRAINEATKDIIATTKGIKKYCLSDEKALNIINSYIIFEQNNIDSLKEYL